MAQWLLASLSPQKPGFDPGLIVVSFVMDILALGQVLTGVILFSPSTFILKIIRSNFCSHAALAWETNGLSLSALKKHNDLTEVEGGGVGTLFGNAFSNKKFFEGLMNLEGPLNVDDFCYVRFSTFRR